MIYHKGYQWPRSHSRVRSKHYSSNQLRRNSSRMICFARSDGLVDDESRAGKYVRYGRKRRPGT